jgi:hypothetical protein
LPLATSISGARRTNSSADATGGAPTSARILLSRASIDFSSMPVTSGRTAASRIRPNTPGMGFKPGPKGGTPGDFRNGVYGVKHSHGMSPASAAESAPQQLTSTITALRHAAKRDKAIEDQKEALRARDPMHAAADYVDIFDLRRRSTMYLTYWTAGDTRNRGREMHAFAQAYRITALKNCLNDLRRQELCLTLRCLSASYRE